MEALISVIVPIYKAEKYLSECIESIQRQTYKNLEIILVDDESPDSCGIICDNYADHDKRIVVLHKQNGGVAAARNSGIEIAKGEYIGFVDADDSIAEDMYEILLNELVKENADIAICKETTDKKELVSGGSDIKKRYILSPAQAIRIMLRGKPYNVSVWNRLYKRKIMDEARFPDGRSAEDMNGSYRFFSKARKVVFIPSNKYYYRQVDGSYCHTSFGKQHLDALKALDEIESGVKKDFPQLLKNVKNRKVNCMAAFLRRMVAADYPDKTIYLFMLQYIRVHVFQYIISDYSMGQKLFAVLCCINPYMAYKIYTVVRKQELK